MNSFCLDIGNYLHMLQDYTEADVNCLVPVMFDHKPLISDLNFSQFSSPGPILQLYSMLVVMQE
jgi:hypothetical protein